MKIHCDADESGARPQFRQTHRILLHIIGSLYKNLFQFINSRLANDGFDG